MIRNNPEAPILALGNITYQHLFRSWHGNTLRFDKRRHPFKPAFLSGRIDINKAVGKNPVIMPIINKGINTLVLDTMRFRQSTIRPHHTMMESIEPTKRAILKRQDYSTINIGDGTHFLGILHAHISETKETFLKSLGIQEIATPAIHDEPHILVAINKHLMWSAVNSLCLKPPLWISVKGFRGILIQAVAQRRMNPQITMAVLHNFID